MRGRLNSQVISSTVIQAEIPQVPMSLFRNALGKADLTWQAVSVEIIGIAGACFKPINSGGWLLTLHNPTLGYCTYVSPLIS
jgi:hypothetical protein